MNLQCYVVLSCLLLLLPSRFSRVQLCATPWSAAYQASLSMGFSRQEHWSGLPFPSPMHESEVAQSCPTLRDPMVCSLPGFSVHGIFQARVLEWGAIAFSIIISTRNKKIKNTIPWLEFSYHDVFQEYYLITWENEEHLCKLSCTVQIIAKMNFS